MRKYWAVSPMASGAVVMGMAYMIRHLVSAQEATARTARKLFPVVGKADDQPTADLLTQRLEVHEKTAWMLRSLLEE